MNRILVLAIGNDILGDDGTAFAVVDVLKKKFPKEIDSGKIYTSGLDILDILEGRQKILIIDTVTTGLNFAGTIYDPDNFRSMPFV